MVTRIPDLPEDVQPGQSGHIAHHDEIHTRLEDLEKVDVQTPVLLSALSSTDQVNWTSISDLDLNTAASGQVWLISYNILYDAANAQGLMLRWAGPAAVAGGMSTTTNTVDGCWMGIDTAAGTNYVLTQSIRYGPTTTNVTQVSFGGLGSGLYSSLRGEFRYTVGSTGLTGQTVDLQFKQIAASSSAPTIILPGSYAVHARVQ